MADEEKLRHYLRKVTGELQRYRRGEQVADRDPIVITGMSCRFPGGVSTPDELWRLLDAGRDAIRPFPEARGWAADSDFGPPECRVGGFLAKGDWFDAEFFGIGPAEASALDPQQRLLLEIAWEALEAGGLDPSSVRGERVGVYVGIAGSRYAMGAEPSDTDTMEHLMTGAAGSAASGRIAYALGLHGPAVSIDTACSSSLATIHLACQALRAGDCSLALAGGVTFMATPDVFIEYARRQGLAADGRCKAFSTAADGMGLGEGAGMLLLERLSDAQRLGHPILAVISGSAIGQDGATNGLTAPSGAAQQQVIRQALAQAGLEPDEVDAIEAHGSGSPLGDQIEARALLQVFGPGRDRPLWLGSIKSNIGHTQVAAGVAGVIKLVLAIRHGRLPRTLFAAEPMPELRSDTGTLSLLADPVDWPATDTPRRAGVSAFGFTGTNAHVIIEEPPGSQTPGTEPPGTAAAALAVPATGPVAWPVSAASPAALRAQLTRLRDLPELAELTPAEVGYTLARSRAAMAYRAVAIGESPAEFLRQLDALSQRTADRVPALGELAILLPARPLTGGTELSATFPAFAELLRAARDELGEQATGALELALVRFLESFGVLADQVLDGDRQPVEPAVTFTLGLGPRSALDRPVDAALFQDGVAEPVALLTALAALFERGFPVRWQAAYAGRPIRQVPLPSYPFQRRRYWLAAGVQPTHPLLGRSLEVAGEPGHRYAHTLDPWYAASHQLFGTPVLPTGALIEWAVAGAIGPDGPPRCALTDVNLGALPPLPVAVQTSVTEAGVRCLAKLDGAWSELVTATTGPAPAPVASKPVGTDGLIEQDIEELQGNLDQAGLVLRGGVSRWWRRGDETVALVIGPVDDAYLLHPLTVQACLQPLLWAEDGLRLPEHVERISVSGRLPERVWCQAVRRAAELFDLTVRDESGQPLLVLDGLRLRAVTPESEAGVAASWLRSRQLTDLLFRDPAAGRQSLLDEVLDRLKLPAGSAQSRLNETGLDSLRAIRLRDGLAREFAVDVPLALLLGGGTPAAVVDLICQQLIARGMLADLAPDADQDIEIFSL